METIIAVSSLPRGISSPLSFRASIDIGVYLTDLELTTSRTKSERRIDWTNLIV